MPGLLTTVLTVFMTKINGMTAYLTDAATTGLDLELVTDIMDIIVEVITKCLGLFTIYPLNLFLVIGIVMLAIGLLGRLKRTAK